MNRNGYKFTRPRKRPGEYLGMVLPVLTMLLVACAGRNPGAIPQSGASQIPGGNARPVTVTPLPSQLPTMHPSATMAATLTPVPSATVSATAATTVVPTTGVAAPNFTNPAVVILAEKLPEPDDLLVGQDGAIYVSDVQDGTIRRITGDGKTVVFLSGINEPEGMVLLADGAMVIVEQGRNRLLRWDPADQSVSPLLDLPNLPGRLGVDGIALDDRSGTQASLIIPDSPNDRLERMTLDGRSVTVIARGLVRPTGASVEADGSILVVEENGGRLDRVRPDGTVEKLTHLPTPDDVVEDAAGNIFVTTLGDGALHWIDAKTGADHVLFSGLSSPQGLALDNAGNLLVTDPGNHRVIKVLIH